MDDDMDTAPARQMGDMRSLRLLRVLVTVLTGVMIVGFLVLIFLFVTRFTSAPPPLTLPESVTLPEGAKAMAITQGRDWFAVVTEDDRILVFDRGTGALRQTVVIAAE